MRQGGAERPARTQDCVSAPIPAEVRVKWRTLKARKLEPPYMFSFGLGNAAAGHYAARATVYRATSGARLERCGRYQGTLLHVPVSAALLPILIVPRLAIGLVRTEEVAIATPDPGGFPVTATWKGTMK